MSSDFWPTALAYFGLSIVSAVIPWVNAELVMISAAPLAASSTALAALVVVFAAGAVGRLVHFTVVACIPELLPRAF
jgi:hypothetical protein